MMKVRCSLEKKYVMKVYKTDVLQSTKKHKTDVAALVGKMMVRTIKIVIMMSAQTAASTKTRLQPSKHLTTDNFLM